MLELADTTLFIQARGALKKELVQHLGRWRVMRRSRHPTQKTPDNGRIVGTASINKRPVRLRPEPYLVLGRRSAVW